MAPGWILIPSYDSGGFVLETHKILKKKQYSLKDSVLTEDWKAM